MNTIKFRAWNKANKQLGMCDILYIDYLNKEVLAVYGETRANQITLKFEEIELMQYIGLKDKNDKEVYEKDIVKCIYGLANDDSLYTGVISMEYYSWCIVSSNNSYLTLDSAIDKNCSFEVIGNIYENPDLLKIR